MPRPVLSSHTTPHYYNSYTMNAAVANLVTVLRKNFKVFVFCWPCVSIYLS